MNVNKDRNLGENTRNLLYQYIARWENNKQIKFIIYKKVKYYNNHMNLFYSKISTKIKQQKNRILLSTWRMNNNKSNKREIGYTIITLSHHLTSDKFVNNKNIIS